MSNSKNDISKLPAWLRELVDEDINFLRRLEEQELSNRINSLEFDDPEFPQVKYGTEKKTQRTEG